MTAARVLLTAALLATLLAGSAFGNETVEELLDRLPAAQGAERIEVLNGLSAAVRPTSPSEAIRYAEEALDLAERHADDTGRIEAILNLGIARYLLAEYDVALVQYERARRLAEDIDDASLLSNALNNIGIIHYVRGEYDLTLEYYEQALELRRRLGDKRALAASLNNLGNVYYATGSYEKSLELLNDSLQLYQEIGEERYTASTLNNIGLAHARLGNNNEALAALERAVPIEKRLDDRSGLALSYNNIGMVYEALERPRDALEKYREALQLRESIGDRQGAAISRHNVGMIQASLGDHETALTNLHAALEVVQDLRIREIERDVYKTLSSVYERIGDAPRALEFHKKFKDTHDQLFDESTAAQLADLESRLEVEKKDREIAVLRKNEQIQRIVRNVSLAGSVLLIALVVLVYNRSRIKARAERAQTRAARAELTHYSRVSIMGELATVLAHELKQPLTAMLSNAQAARRLLAAGNTSKEDIDEALKDIVGSAGRARDVIQRLRSLIRPGDITRGPLGVPALIREIESFALADVRQHGIELEFDLDENLPLISGDRIQLQQVLLNLVHNGAEAMATDSTHGGSLLIRASAPDPDNVLIAVRDSGPGLDDESLERMFEPFFTNKTDGLGMGLPICQSIVEAHDGRLWAERNDDRGLTVQFTVPRHVAA